MSDADRLLAELWAADEPPARDAAFLISALQGLERRRFWLGLASLVPLALAAAAALWALAPHAAAVVAALSSGLQPGAVLPTAAALTGVWLLLWLDRPASPAA